MKAINLITEWCDKKYAGAKDIGDWTTSEVLEFAEYYAKEKIKYLKDKKKLRNLNKTK